jgi:dienelactone hydrolase
VTVRLLLAAGVLVCNGMAQKSPQQTRAAFLQMIDRPKVALAPEIAREGATASEGATAREGATEAVEHYRFSFAADSSQRVPGLLYRPAGKAAKLPVVIVLHGTGGSKQGQVPLLRQLAARGFMAIAIDGRYHGERSTQGTGSADYQAAMLRTYMTGREHPFLYDTVWDVMRLIDYIQTLPDADSARIGLMGISKGGMETYLTAAVDPRVAVAVPCIGVQSFRWALDHDSWQSRAGTFRVALDGAARHEGAGEPAGDFLRHFYDRVAPGIYSDFDGPAMLPLIAPRPLLTINGETDPRTPMPGLQECLEAAKKAYAAAPDRLQSIIEEKTGHAVTPAAQAAAIAWFGKWLL